jgi:hypothetical protein
MNKTQKQSGFAHLESLLLLVVVAIIGFTFWYVWHSRNNANKSFANAANTNQTGNYSKKAPNTKSPAKSPVKVAVPSLVNYTDTNAAGLEVSSESDVDKLDGASDSFKDFIKDKIKKNGNSPSPCGNAYGIFVKKIYKDGFALGGEGQCGGAEKLWAKVSSQWQEIGGTQQGFDCSLLEQYKVPSAIIEQCIKNGNLVDNTVQG